MYSSFQDPWHQDTGVIPQVCDECNEQRMTYKFSLPDVLLNAIKLWKYYVQSIYSGLFSQITSIINIFFVSYVPDNISRSHQLLSICIWNLKPWNTKLFHTSVYRIIQQYVIRKLFPFTYQIHLPWPWLLLHDLANPVLNRSWNVILVWAVKWHNRKCTHI